MHYQKKNFILHIKEKYNDKIHWEKQIKAKWG